MFTYYRLTLNHLKYGSVKKNFKTLSLFLYFFKKSFKDSKHGFTKCCGCFL